MKKMKSTMKQFINNIHCKSCGRGPREGEKIDNWRLKRTDSEMLLTCAECYQVQLEWESNEEV